MTEPNDHPTPASSSADQPEPEGKKIGPLGVIGAGFAALFLVAGLVVSLVVLVRDDDAPLVQLGDPAGSPAAAPDPAAGQFEPAPVFDPLGRVSYVPRNPAGVILDQSAPTAGRPATTPPSGVMLQRIHGNMTLPFSTSDGPTAIDDSGVATGFAHTPQGAALAAAHYLAYLFGGNDRVDMLAASGQVDDPDRDLLVKKRANDLRGEVWQADGAPAAAMPSVRVDYADPLARVWFGYSASTEGRTTYSRIRTDVLWTGDRGWVLQARRDYDPQGPTAVGTRDENPFEAGWTTWW